MVLSMEGVSMYTNGRNDIVGVVAELTSLEQRPVEEGAPVEEEDEREEGGGEDD